MLCRFSISIHSLFCLFLAFELVNSQMCMDWRARSGNCVPLVSCPQLVEEYYAMSIGMDFQAYAGGSICGFDGSQFMICCAADGNRTPKYLPGAPAPPPPPPPQYATVSPQNTYFHFSSLGGLTTAANPTVSVFQPTPPPRPPNMPGPMYPPAPAPPSTPALRSSGCGISSVTTNRVVGGTESRRGAYPWLAALGYLDEYDRNKLKYLCAGSLINNRFVLTSGHCINPSLKVVRLGAHDISKANEANAVNVPIKRSILHEQFDLASIANDIALVELSTAAPYSSFIGPICLPESSNFLTQDFVGMNPFVAGWGAVKYHGPTSNVLRDVQVPVVSRQVCEQSYKSVFQFVNFSDKLICAGNSNVDACNGDSGGPLMVPQLDGSVFRFYLLGVVSFGYECARTGFPGVYTRIATYIPWIRQHAI